MSEQGSITQWLQQLAAGEREGIQRIWERYFHRLVSLARRNLEGVPRVVGDEEDIALSAFKSFCLAAEQKRFPVLQDRQDLWQILVMLTLRKASNQKKFHRRQKRRSGRVKNQTDLTPEGAQADGEIFANMIRSEEPDPQFSVEIADQFEFLLGRLDNEEFRSIAIKKMEGYTNEEVASHVGCSLPTVERRMRVIRKVWLAQMTAQENG